MTRPAAHATALTLALALAACGAKPPPPATLALTLTGSADQNAGASGQGAPVAVHLYELASAEKFRQADALALIQREQATLGPDLLAAEQIVLAPSETREIRKELNPGARYLGVAALFQDIDNANWRAVAPLAPNAPNRYALRVGRLAVTLEPVK